MSFSDLYEGYIVPASTLLPIGAGIADYKKSGKAMNRLFYYLCIALLINIAGIIMAHHSINNLPLLHFYTLFELEAVMWYYLAAFPGWAGARWIKAIMIAYPILCIINFTFLQSIYSFNTYTRPLEAIIIIGFSGWYLSAQGDTDIGRLHNAGRWVAFGFLLYFCSSLFMFIFANVVTSAAPGQLTRYLWDIHDTFVLIMYIFFFIAFKHERRNR